MRQALGLTWTMYVECVGGISHFHWVFPTVQHSSHCKYVGFCVLISGKHLLKGEPDKKHQGVVSNKHQPEQGPSHHLCSHWLGMVSGLSVHSFNINFLHLKTTEDKAGDRSRREARVSSALSIEQDSQTPGHRQLSISLLPAASLAARRTRGLRG